MDLIQVYPFMADLHFWLKLQTEEPLFFSDVPNIAVLRWAHLRDNWDFIVDELQADILDDSLDDIEDIRLNIDEFGEFIETQKTIDSNVNPLTDRKTFHRFFRVFEVLPVNLLPTNNSELTEIKKEQQRVGQFTRTDFIEIKRQLQKFRDEHADITNVADMSYNTAFNRSSATAQLKITIRDIQLMKKIQDGISVVDFILANITDVEKVSIDPFALARQNANNAEIDITTYSSGKLVKMEFGDNLQKIANRYLGSPDKWMDIAIANGLQPPYIDEDGETIIMLTNGDKNQISIGPGAGEVTNINKVYVNQIIQLWSEIYPFHEQRKIINIRKIPVSNEIVIELDGPTDLDRFLTDDNATIRVFKPHTINSDFYILIPSNRPIDDETLKEVPWFLESKAEDEKRARVDLALSSENDLIFNNSHDLKLSYGLDNAVQAIKLKFGVEKGELRQHPDFGLVSVVGQTNRNLSELNKVLNDSIVFQIENDSRFERITSLDVTYLPNTGESAVGFLIRMSVQLAGSDVVVPISFMINT